MLLSADKDGGECTDKAGLGKLKENPSVKLHFETVGS